MKGKHAEPTSHLRSPTPTRAATLTFRSYGPAHQLHAHEHLQIVLPAHGELEIEVEGSLERVDRASGLVLAPGAMHDQSAQGTNRFLIVDCDPALIDPRSLEKVSKRPSLPLSEAAHRLIQFAELSATKSGIVAAQNSAHLLPLLLGTLLAQPTTPAARFDRLLRDITNSLGSPWSLATMARRLGESERRTQARFESQLGTTPQLWLTETRLRRAQHLLAQSQLSVAEIALELGYSDQTALTRAMRRELGQTPAAYRRLQQQ